ncbi:MAG: hypothetical protein QM704_07125 [Anaeromyxobacteraceae bacterium]
MPRLAAPLLAAFALALPVAARGGDLASFFDKATRVPDLAAYVARATTPCAGSAAAKARCQRDVAKLLASSHDHQKLARVSGAGLVRILPRGDALFLLVSSRVPAGQGSLTHGTPEAIEEGGEPATRNLETQVYFPPDTAAADRAALEAALRAGPVDVELVFTPRKPWTLGDQRGLAANFFAIRVLDPRTGKPLAEEPLAIPGRKL